MRIIICESPVTTRRKFRIRSKLAREDHPFVAAWILWWSFVVVALSTQHLFNFPSIIYIRMERFEQLDDDVMQWPIWFPSVIRLWSPSRDWSTELKCHYAPYKWSWSDLLRCIKWKITSYKEMTYCSFHFKHRKEISQFEKWPAFFLTTFIIRRHQRRPILLLRRR